MKKWWYEVMLKIGGRLVRCDMLDCFYAIKSDNDPGGYARATVMKLMDRWGVDY